MGCKIIRIVLTLVSGFLFCGCASFRVGVDEVSKAEYRKTDLIETAINSIHMSPEYRSGRLTVSVSAETTSSLKETKTTVISGYERLLSIGVCPGWDEWAQNDPDLNQNLIYPLWIVPMSNAIMLGLPTLFSLLVEPFSEEGLWLSSIGIAGATRYRSSSIITITNSDVMIVQKGIVDTVPVPDVAISCRIPSLGFQATGVTDEQGIFSLPLDTRGSRRAEIILRIESIRQSRLAKHLRELATSEKSFNLALDGKTLANRPATALALESPNWELDSLAIADFPASGMHPDEADAYIDWFYSAIIETGYFRTRARAEIRDVLREQEFQRSGMCDDTQCLVEMGNLLAVKYTVGGRLSLVGSQVLLTLRLVDVETAEVIASSRASVGNDSASIRGAIDSATIELCANYKSRTKRHL